MASIGERLLSEGLITEIDLEKALRRQRQEGGRIGQNLIAIEAISQEDLGRFLKKHPTVPGSIEDTGLPPLFLTDLIIKHISAMGDFMVPDVAEAVKLPISIVNKIIETTKKDRLVEVTGGSSFSSLSYNYRVTDLGKSRGAELMDLCRYVGPAPVTLEAYNKMVAFQTVKHIVVSQEAVKNAFSHLVLSESLLKRLGPAISSGRAMFVYGPSGNGKTAIAETIGNLLPDYVYIPYAVTVGGQIIIMYDPVNHVLVENNGNTEDVDHRWVRIHRPIIMTGGELSLKMLDLDFNTASKYYEASLQMRANNGLFIADDFGRQQVDPQSMLNRWIVPLERRLDFMTLHTGIKFEIPFDMLVIFSTNLQPKDLADEAFLRRIRYKIKIDHPSEEKFEVIFKKECEKHQIAFNKDVFRYLIDNYYLRSRVKLNACHPRDIIDHIIDSAHYFMHPPRMTREGIDAAWQNYFVDM